MNFAIVETEAQAQAASNDNSTGARARAAFATCRAWAAGAITGLLAFAGLSWLRVCLLALGLLLALVGVAQVATAAGSCALRLASRVVLAYGRAAIDGLERGIGVLSSIMAFGLFVMTRGYVPHAQLVSISRHVVVASIALLIMASTNGLLFDLAGVAITRLA